MPGCPPDALRARGLNEGLLSREQRPLDAGHDPHRRTPQRRAALARRRGRRTATSARAAARLNEGLLSREQRLTALVVLLMTEHAASTKGCSRESSDGAFLQMLSACSLLPQRRAALARAATARHFIPESVAIAAPQRRAALARAATFISRGVVPSSATAPQRRAALARAATVADEAGPGAVEPASTKGCSRESSDRGL